MKILKLLFPFYFNSKIKLTKKQRKYIDKLDKQIGLLGMEIVELEYEFKCNRSISLDICIQFISIIISLIILYSIFLKFI